MLRGVLYDRGVSDVAVALGDWDGRPVIAMRWNGSDQPGNALGNPQSSGHSTWFVVPDFLSGALVSILRACRDGGDVRVNRAEIDDATRLLPSILGRAT